MNEYHKRAMKDALELTQGNFSVTVDNMYSVLIAGLLIEILDILKEEQRVSKEEREEIEKDIEDFKSLHTNVEMVNTGLEPPPKTDETDDDVPF